MPQPGMGETECARQYSGPTKPRKLVLDNGGCETAMRPNLPSEDNGCGGSSSSCRVCRIAAAATVRQLVLGPIRLKTSSLLVTRSTTELSRAVELQQLKCGYS